MKALNQGIRYVGRDLNQALHIYEVIQSGNGDIRAHTMQDRISGEKLACLFRLLSSEM
jgi:hypothetical protein